MNIDGIISNECTVVMLSLPDVVYLCKMPDFFAAHGVKVSMFISLSASWAAYLKSSLILEKKRKKR